MKILFLTHFYTPHIGGVERHLSKLNEELYKRGHEITTITEQYDSKIKNVEINNDEKMFRIKYPRVKLLGIIIIWLEIFKLRRLIKEADIVHIHDVFIWYLPFRLLYPSKKVFLTIHGLEWGNPTKTWSLFQKRVAVYLSNGSIGIGKFLEKYIKTKFNFILYGGLEKINLIRPKKKNSLLFVGRLESDTGLEQFLKWLEINNKKQKYIVEFVGNGTLREKCSKFGKVYGFCDPIPFYKKTETVVPSGYLTYLEAKSYGCKIKTFYGNELKKDYWDEILHLKKFDTWEDVANKYIKLWER